MGDFSTKMMKRGKRICRRHVDLVSGVPCDHASDHHAVIVIIIIITTDNQKCVILNNEKHFWWNSLCVTSSVAKPCTLHTQKVMGLSANLNQLVGGLEPFFFHSVGNFIIPTDEVIFFRGVGQPPTSKTVLSNTDNQHSHQLRERNFLVGLAEDVGQVASRSAHLPLCGLK